MEKTNGNLIDNLNIMSHNEIRTQLGPSENVIYSNKAKKFNALGLSQDISIIITDNFLFIFSKSKLKSKVESLRLKTPLGLNLI